MSRPFSRRHALALGVVFLLSFVGLWWLRATENRQAPAPANRGGHLVGTVRSDPRSFNRFVVRDRTSNLVSVLVHDKLVRINLATQEVEPSLAQAWTPGDHGRTWTVRLREGVTFADGEPFTSADVLFSLAAAYDPKTSGALGGSLLVGGQPLAAIAPDARTVVFTFPAPFGPGIRLLDNLPILPKHKLGAALETGTLREAWALTTPPSEMTGLGPFVLREYRPGERLVFDRNPKYWRRDTEGHTLPRLDSLTVLIVPDQNAELLRLESGEADLLSGEVRPEDLPAMKRAADRGALTLHDVGVGLDPDFLWFNLEPGAFPASRAWLQSRELREAISLGVDRRALADTVYFGAAMPVAGPVTPGNRDWHDPSLAPPGYDPARARQLLAAAGLTDRDGNGQLETATGVPGRFALLTQKGNTLRERCAAFIQQDLARLGLTVDVVTLEVPALIQRITAGNYEAAFFGFQFSDTDPAMNLDLWLSTGAFHPWNPEQASPATDWEARVDTLMHQQVASSDPDERKRLFREVQAIFARELPLIHFVAPEIWIVTSARVTGARPGLVQPYILWDAASLGVK